MVDSMKIQERSLSAEAASLVRSTDIYVGLTIGRTFSTVLVYITATDAHELTRRPS